MENIEENSTRFFLASESAKTDCKSWQKIDLRTAFEKLLQSGRGKSGALAGGRPPRPPMEKPYRLDEPRPLALGPRSRDSGLGGAGA